MSNIKLGLGPVSLQKSLLVGVHIRGGDMQSEESKSRGYKVPHQSYYLKAIIYFLVKFKSVHFLVISDDRKYCKTIMDPVPKALYTLYGDISASTGPLEDLTAMSVCDHVIGSVGTYSWWWAAWLAGGQVVMFNSSVLLNSQVGYGFNKDDYFPVEWHLMGN